MCYSENCRDAFSRSGWPDGAFQAIHGAESLVDNDTAVEFVSAERVDHYGNVPGAAGQRPDGRPSDRVTYWFPADDARWMPADVSSVLPVWAVEAVAAYQHSAGEGPKL
jgi:hypothetical protein